MALLASARWGDLAEVAEKLESGQRLGFSDGVRLFKTNDLFALGRLADAENRRRNGERAYFIQNRHINYSNVCMLRCRFCAFARPNRKAPGAYEMSVEEVVAYAARGYHDGIREFHIVGGVHPTLPLGYYLEMLRALKDAFPGVHLKALTAVEVRYLARKARLSVEATLERLMEAGLDSLPGGGAEIFDSEVRRQICAEKMSGEEWLAVHRAAHRLGLRSTATMLYGHIESVEARVDHLLRLRDLQDETGGFLAFVPLAYHPENTEMGGSLTSGLADLRTIAASRLILDNFQHIKAYWVMMGLRLAQVALAFGADDLDGTIVEERVYHAAGASSAPGVTREELVHVLRMAGRIPVERDSFYRPLGFF